MSSIYYHTIGGKIRGETEATRRDYLTDALGSVTATTNNAAQVENTYRAKPYGAALANTGIANDPRFLWTGDEGSRFTGLRISEQYNRARHYMNLPALWTTKDPLWPKESGFIYALNQPTAFTDPSGLRISTGKPCKCYECDGPIPRPDPTFVSPIGPAISTFCDRVSKCRGNAKKQKRLIDCIRGCQFDKPRAMVECFHKSCTGSNDVVVDCGGSASCWTGMNCGFTIPTPRGCYITMCTVTTYEQCQCYPSGRGYTAYCEKPDCNAVINIAHEMAHCCGLGIDLLGNSGVGDCIALCVEDCDLP